MTKRPIRIMCVDDHAFLVNGLVAQFDLEDDLEFAGRLENAEHLLDEVRNVRPDVVLLDIEMPGPDPFEAASAVRRQFPHTKIVFLSAYVRDQYISMAFRAGAWGYFSKSDSPDVIVEGLRKVAAGEFAAGPKVASRCQPSTGNGKRALRPPASRIEQLTRREREILRLIGKGMTRAEIAHTLHRSTKTVDGHRINIMKKLDVHDRGELVRFAIGEGLVEA